MDQPATRQLRLRSDLVEWRLVDGEVIALDLRTSRYLGLNPTAALVWQTVASGSTEPDLVDQVVAKFEVAREEAATDVAAFIADLESRGLLEAEPQ